MAKKSVDVSFTASNFFSFSQINEANESARNLQKLLSALPDAVKKGDLEKQLQWKGDKQKLMPLLQRAKLVRAGVFLSYALIAAGSLVIATSFFYTSATLPVIGLIITASGIVLHPLSRFYNLVRPKFDFSMHTHGVFIWGEISHVKTLKKIVDRLAC